MWRGLIASDKAIVSPDVFALEQDHRRAIIERCAVSDGGDDSGGTEVVEPEAETQDEGTRSSSPDTEGAERG